MALFVLPALSVAVHVSIQLPGHDVSTFAQLALTTPESASEACGTAAGSGFPSNGKTDRTIVVVSVGGVSSSLTVMLALPVLPATSLQVAIRLKTPSVVTLVVCGHCAL